jgi:predicted ATP-dependent protease
VRDLTLNDEVIEAVREGNFHIYPVRTIDEGIEILTGAAAGQEQPDGSYPPNTVHHLVSSKLKGYMDTLIQIGKSAEGDKV